MVWFLLFVLAGFALLAWLMLLQFEKQSEPSIYKNWYQKPLTGFERLLAFFGSLFAVLVLPMVAIFIGLGIIKLALM